MGKHSARDGQDGWDEWEYRPPGPGGPPDEDFGGLAGSGGPADLDGPADLGGLTDLGGLGGLGDLRRLGGRGGLGDLGRLGDRGGVPGPAGRPPGPGTPLGPVPLGPSGPLGAAGPSGPLGAAGRPGPFGAPGPAGPPRAGGPGAPLATPSAPGAMSTPGTGRRRRGDSPDDTGGFTVLGPRDAAGRPQPHPEHREHSAWGPSGGWAGPAAGRGGRSRGSLGPHGSALDAVEEWAEDWEPYDTAAMRPAAMGTAAAQGRLSASGGRIPRPRQEFVDAFDLPAAAAEQPAAAVQVTPLRRAGERPSAEAPAEPGDGRGGGWGRTLSGVAAAAVVTVLAVVVGGQAAGERHHPHKAPGSGSETDDPTRATPDAASRSRARPAVAAPGATADSYDALMARRYPLDPKLKLSGAFTTVPGTRAAPGRGRVMRFRVDVERGLPLDAGLFSDAVFTTLNDPRSWGHGGTMTFERVSTGPADIVVTLASPGTTDAWCAKSGLDTSVDNVSCDSASTPRTMINAYRWAQGAATFGPDLMHSYRQMLINHEVGHRLGHDHVGCPKEGALAPVMMQQTKFLSLDGGPTCKPNAWPYP